MLSLRRIPDAPEARILSNVTATHRFRTILNSLSGATISFPSHPFCATWGTLLGVKPSDSTHVEDTEVPRRGGPTRPNMAFPSLVRLSCGDQILSICITRHTIAALDLLDAWLREMGDEADVELVDIMQRTALAPLLSIIEKLVPGVWQLSVSKADAIDDTSNEADRVWWLPIEVTLGEHALSGWLSGNAAAVTALEQTYLLSRPACHRLDSTQRNWAKMLRMPSHVCIGQRAISLARLRTLQIGEVLLGICRPLRNQTIAIEALAALQGQVVWGASGGPQLVAPVVATTSLLTFVDHPRKQDIMSLSTDGSTAEVADISIPIEDLVLKIEARIALPDMSVQALMNVAPDYTLLTKLDPGRALVTLYANGKRFGDGELVSVGDEIGVIVRSIHQSQPSEAT